ncbi:hypothetical protein [Bacillus cereus]|nr:hypothetical protein [Bacillus cereus]
MKHYSYVQTLKGVPLKAQDLLFIQIKRGK